jgi:succinate-semialdehyde dehydrogenase/glutarate-semialdehyde dehydrogenase
MTQASSPLTQLQDPSLIKHQGLINGQWVSGSNTFRVDDPTKEVNPMSNNKIAK